MTRSDNQRLKLLYLQRIFMENTDDMHFLTMRQILAELDKFGIKTTRKTTYTDIDDLQRYGMDIVQFRKGSLTYYHLRTGAFEVNDLRNIVSAVRAYDGISGNKKRCIISKIKRNMCTYDIRVSCRDIISDR